MSRARSVSQVTPDAFNLDDFLPYQVSVLADALSRSLSQVYQQRFGITVPEWRILAQLNKESPLSAKEVSLRTNMDKPRVSRALARLDRGGLIKRRQDPADRRIAMLELSARGRTLIQELIPHLHDWEAALYREVGSRDSAQLAALCKHMTDVLKARES